MSDLDPDIRIFVETVAADAARHPDSHAIPYAEARRNLEHVRRRWVAGGPDMARSVDLEVPTRHGAMNARLHAPHGDGALPLLVYLHGGGWTFFSIETHDRVMREYADRAGVAVLGLDYALSPEAKFPVALHQTIDAVRWVQQDAARLGVDPARISVGGDSAGANLALATALALRDEGDVGLVQGLVLNYGAYDAHCSDAAHRFGGPGYMLGSEEMAVFWRNYTWDPRDLENPLVCPARADVTGLPPVFMAIPQCDLLTEQNELMADRFRAAGVAVDARVYQGATHSFLEAVSIAAVSARALDDTAGWLRRNNG
ncbi:MAG: alpha/beta hydrolase fold domain-containing protein [Gammaproteobacteria bacterium]